MSRLIRFVLYSLYLLLAASGLVYLVAGLYGSAPWAGIGMLTVACAMGYAVSGYVKRGTALAAVGAMLLIAAGSVILLPFAGWNAVLAILNVVCVIIGARHKWNEEDTRLIDLHLLAAGLVIDAAAYIVAILNGCEAPQPQIGYTTYAFVCVTILLVNRRTVQLNAGGQARRMMRSNQILAWSFVGVFTLAVFFGPLQRWVGEMIRWAVTSFFALFDKEDTGGTFAPTDTGAEGDLDLSYLDGDVKEWPQWVQVLSDVFLYTVTIIVVLAVIAFVIWAMVRAIRKLSVYLKDWFSTFGAAGNDEYSEESEQLMSAQRMREQFSEEVKRRIRKVFERPVRWNALTPNERVRRVYSHILEQEKRISVTAENLTPHQLCAVSEKDAEFADIYGRVRYAEQEVSAQEAEKWRGYLKG